MAQVAKSQPRSGAHPRLRLSDAPRLSPFDWRIEDLDLTPQVGRTVTIGRQTYREVDNGTANVLVPAHDALRSPAEYAEHQRALRQAARVAQSPFGALAYNALALAKAPKRVRDAGLEAGGILDAMAGGRAARTGPVRRQPISPGAQVAPSSVGRDNVRMRELNEAGQATGVTATITAPMLGTGTKADSRLKPPGWLNGQEPDFDARGHLLAREFGGPGGDPRNLVTLSQRGANHPHMSGFEHGVAGRVRSGEVVEYSATPLYGAGRAPSAVLVTAVGSRGAPSARIIQNPAGRRE